ncbi:MAG: cation transporter [Bacteroidetes bacterium]|nr:MAG: cation transporter [Bacteroidota bacterium]
MKENNGSIDKYDSTKNIRVAFFLNLTFTIFEFIGGYYTNSVAIMADAVHDLGDSIALGLSWNLDKKSKQQRDNKFTFGYKRFSLLGALINGLVLVIGSAFILIKTIPRLIYPEHADAEGMLWFAIVGILVNGFSVIKLSSGKTLNEKMVRWHLIEDVIGWVAVFIVSIVLMFYDVPILDPLLSLGIISYVLYNVIKNLKETFLVFLQGVPSDIDYMAIESAIINLKEVKSVHRVHVWSLDGASTVMTIHVVINDVKTSNEMIFAKRKVREVLNDYSIEHSTIEIELYKEDSLQVPAD